MEEVFYKKVGRRYVAVSYYDANVMDAIPEGAHLIVKRPGSTSRRHNIDPAVAPMIAAGIYAEDKISTAIMKASELRVPKSQHPLTEEQRAAWEHLAKTFGQETLALEWPSYRESAEAGVKALQAEAEKMLANPSVRSAYEHFMLMCKLAYKESNNEYR
jgi:hypothetical protein